MPTFTERTAHPFRLESYCVRYFKEMEEQQEMDRRTRGPRCGRQNDHAALLPGLHRPNKCHRTLLKGLIEKRAAELQSQTGSDMASA